jgi:hypothetical protein
MIDLKWFNVSAPKIKTVRLWNLFNRVSDDGHYWGIGFLQIRTWHLLYIGDAGFRLCQKL